MPRRYKVSAALLTAVLVVSGLLVPTPAELGMGGPGAPALAEPVKSVDLAHCHGPSRELRFEWLKPGDKAMAPAAGAAVCVAVYRLQQPAD